MAAKVAKLSKPPKVARPLTGSGRVPELKNLVKKTPEQLVSTLKRFGIEPDLVAIEKRASRAFERLDAILEKGIEPDAATWKDLAEQVERDVTAALRDITKGAIRNYRLHRASQLAGLLTWVAVVRNSCASCLARHGKTKSLKQWERAGLPGSPVLACSSGLERRCRCQLQPDPLA